jgi:hypothetical protein
MAASGPFLFQYWRLLLVDVLVALIVVVALAILSAVVEPIPKTLFMIGAAVALMTKLRNSMSISFFNMISSFL